jgi:hypothetical protein
VSKSAIFRYFELTTLAPMALVWQLLPLTGQMVMKPTR